MEKLTELINEFDKANIHLSKVLEIWENLDEQDDKFLTEHYNLTTSFDEIVYAIFCFVKDLTSNRNYPHS